MSLVPKYSPHHHHHQPFTDSQRPSSQHTLQLKYQLLSPHPPFLTSISSKLKDAILFNSGDMLFAIFIDRNLFAYNSLSSSSSSNFSNNNNNKSSSVAGEQREHVPVCYCHQLQQQQQQQQQKQNRIQESKRTLTVFGDESLDTNTQQQPWTTVCNKTLTLHNDCGVTNEDNNIISKSNIGIIANHGNIAENNRTTIVHGTLSDREKDVSNLTNCNGTVTVYDNDCAKQGTLYQDNDGRDGNIPDFVSFVQQGFTLHDDDDDDESPGGSQPDSPFDCTETEIPCSIATVDGQVQLRKSFEHRCFKLADKGLKTF